MTLIAQSSKNENDQTMRTLFISIVIFLFFNIKSYSQDYDYALGASLGNISGVFYKQFTTDEAAVIRQISFIRGGAQLAFLRQYHQPIMLETTDKLFFYFGYGVHVGYYTYGKKIEIFNNKPYTERYLSAGIGIQGNLGFEYHFIKYPLVLGLDYRPYFELNVPDIYSQRHGLAVIIMYAF